MNMNDVQFMNTIYRCNQFSKQTNKMFITLVFYPAELVESLLSLVNKVYTFVIVTLLEHVFMHYVCLLYTSRCV